jgi:dihydroflavonol-4-reductase
MRTLVTGATGFIGSHLAERLLDAGEPVSALVRPGGDRRNVAPLCRKGLTLVEGDLLDEASLDRALDGITHVHHIAGLVSTRKRDQQKLDDLNYTATLNLWRACRRAEVGRICYLGSIFALAGGSRRPLDEDAPYTLESLPVPYFRAKRRAELATRDEAERGLPIVFAYPGYCLGPNDIYFSSMTVVDAFIRGELPAYIEGGMNFLDVRDAAAGLDLAMKRGKVGRRYLITDHNLTWGELFAELAEITGRRPPRLRVPKPLAALMGRALETVWPNAPLDRARVEVMGNHYWYDSTRARTELGWQGRSLATTLFDGVAWLKKFGRPAARPA